jgi:hypothetical protein
MSKLKVARDEVYYDGISLFSRTPPYDIHPSFFVSRKVEIFFPQACGIRLCFNKPKEVVGLCQEMGCSSSATNVFNTCIVPVIE